MKDLIKQSEKELLKLLDEKREGLRQFRFGVSGSKTKNVREGRSIRKDIARILTQLSVLSNSVVSNVSNNVK